ncbi:MAG TPA: S41 family peptidase [Spirochaetia bacterium]|nr:S41 family peptidase [Spirochaetia bacterium]
MKTSADPSPLTVFDEIWGFVDTHYSFFALKDVDWNQIRAEYRPRVGSDMTDFELFDLLSEMLYELRDGHVNLRSPFDLSRHWEWYLGYPQNFDATLLEREYFRGDQEYAGPFVVYDFGDVAYLRYPSFSGTIASEHLDYLFTRFAGRAGLILDLRDNGGGSTSNAYRLANRLVDSRTERGYQQYKSGPGHEDFTEAQPVVIVPPAGAVLWQKPFVVLTNRSSYSATNTFVALAKGLDQVRVIGDTTGGGGGIPAYTELSNEWILRVSAHRFIAEDEGGGQLNIELGIDPDESVDMTDSDLELGKDTILEAALSYIREL